MICVIYALDLCKIWQMHSRKGCNVLRMGTGVGAVQVEDTRLVMMFSRSVKSGVVK